MKAAFARSALAITALAFAALPAQAQFGSLIDKAQKVKLAMGAGRGGGISGIVFTCGSFSSRTGFGATTTRGLLPRA